MQRTRRLNPIQVAASAAGAVLAAVIASFFGVEGTIIGTAVGSIVATTASALVWESIERGHEAVRQVVVKDSPLLHRGSTASSGVVTRSEAEASAVVAEVDAGLAATVAAGDLAQSGEPGVPEVVGPDALAETATAGGAEVRQQSPLDPTRQDQVAGAGAAASGTEASDFAVTGPRRLVTSSRAPSAGRLGGSAQVRRTAASPARRSGVMSRFRRPWVALASIAAVFVVAMGVVTVVEVIAGRPLSSLFQSGNAPAGTSWGQALGTTETTTSTTTSTTVPSSSTTSSSTTTSTSTTTSSTSTTTTSTTTPTSSSTTTTTTPSGGGTSGATGTANGSAG